MKQPILYNVIFNWYSQGIISATFRIFRLNKQLFIVINIKTNLHFYQLFSC